MASSKASTVDCSLQEQKEQVIDVMFLCDEWKSSKGGLSTFNREFAINMAETATSSMKIHCYVSKSDDQDREDARQHGVNLITAPSIPGSDDSFERLKFPPSELPNPHLVIGHGRKFGRCAYFLVQATKCRWIQFVHVYCEDLGKYKESTTAATDSIEENEAKHKSEIELCKAADAVVAVGSRLQQKYSRSLPNVKVEIITPGIFEKFSSSGSQFALHRSAKNFHVFLFGRATFEDLSLKGYDIVANAIGSLGKNFELTFVGSPPGEHRKVEQWLLKNKYINRNQLTIRGYCSDPEELKMMFYQSDLVALPSRTEGFGLVALEAISAGVPILVSRECGIAEALRKVEGGNTVIVESDEDADDWARRIREMSEESAEEREANAMRLRENYRKVYSWRTECARFRGMIENVMKTANDEELNIKVEVEECKPKETNMQTTTKPTESGGCQGVQYQRASAMLPTEGSVSHSGTEDCQANRVMSFIAMNYLETMRPKSSEDHNKFMDYMREMRVIITGDSLGSLVITVKCESLQILEKLWLEYSSGRLGEMVQNCFVTEKILREFNLTELKLKTTMDIEEYKARKVYFERVTPRDALCPQSYFTSSEGHEPHLERGKQKIEVAKSEKMKETGRLSEMVHSTRPTNIWPPARYKPDFNAFLVSIADEVTKEELEKMKFLCARQVKGNYLPRGKLHAIKNPREFLTYLHQKDEICPEDVSYLVWLLRNVGCNELAASIEIQGPTSSPGDLHQNLPHLTAYFVGRDAEVHEIEKKLQTFRMVVLLSIPGMGKTEVGIRVSHLLKERGDQFVTHIRVKSHHQKLADICSEILDRFSSRTWSPTADFMSIAKGKLSERNIPTVIVLDNTENIQGEEFDEFAKWLVKSAPNVKLIITTRKDVGFLSEDVFTFSLKPLDPHSSATLLRNLVDDCSEEHSKELAKLCGGIPLLLVTCSDSLNNGFSRELLIQELGNNPIRLFRISANDVYNTLEVFFNTLSNEVKTNLVLFSVFPSEFSAEDIQFLFEDSLHCETVKTRMVKYALLQREADGKVRMHPLVQAYFRTEKESLGMGDLWRATQRKFNRHYLGQLRDSSRKFITKNSALVAIHKFQQQKANIMEALKNCLEDSSDLNDKHFVLDVVNSTEVLDFVAEVLTSPKECTALYQKCCNIAEARGDKKRYAESLNSLGFRRLCDVSHSKDSPEENQVTLAMFQEAYYMRRTLPEEEQKTQTHAHTASKLGVCLVLQGEEKKGRELIREGILIRNSLSGCLYVAAGFCDLGNSYRLCGAHQKAIDIWKENTLPVYKEQLGDHPWTASILSYIADSYKALAAGSSERGYIDQAEMYFREAQGLRERLLGHHLDTARTCVQLSDVLVLQG